MISPIIANSRETLNCTPSSQSIVAPSAYWTIYTIGNFKKLASLIRSYVKYFFKQIKRVHIKPVAAVQKFICAVCLN